MAEVDVAQLTPFSEHEAQSQSLDEATLNTFAPRVYELGTKNIRLLDNMKNAVVTGDSRFCMFANPAAQAVLAEVGIDAKFKTLHLGDFAAHGFLVVEGKGEKPDTLVDYQSRMFVPSSIRDKAPDCMVVPFTSKEELVEGLKEHNIPENKFHRWTEVLFPEKIDLEKVYPNPLMDMEEMKTVGEEARKRAQQASIHPTIDVTPLSKVSTRVNDEAAELLKARGVHAEYMALDKGGSTIRGFIRVNDPQKRLIDYQYKSHVPTLYYDKLPDYLDIPYTTKEDVIAGLNRYHVPPDIHWHWLEELFSDE